MADNTGLQDLTIDDFSGGITDFYLGGAVNAYEKAENFVINENADLITRPGSAALLNEHTFPAVVPRKFIDNQDDILIQGGTSVKAVSGDISNVVVSPQAHNVFTKGSDSSKCSFAYWNKHSLAGGDAFAPLQKIYRNASNNWTVTQLGLPEMVYQICIQLANEIKQDFNAHILDLTQHTNAHSSQIVSNTAADFESLFALTAELSLKFKTHEADARLPVPAHHIATTVLNHALLSAATPQNAAECYARLVELKSKLNSHDANAVAHTTPSLHQVSSPTDMTITGTAGTKNYIYAFHYQYRYVVGTTEFLERGPTHLIERTLINEPSTNAVTISNIPVLNSGTYNNWDDANITIVITRTTDGGSTFYFNREITNGTTTVTDNMSDAVLSLNETMYTEGGILDDEAPLPAKFIAVVDDVTVMAHVKEGTIIRGNRVKFSKRGKPFSSPAFFYKDFEDDTTGVGYIGVNPIIFLNDKTFRLEGGFDEFGGGGYVKRDISQDVGCIAPDSIVVTQKEIYFAAKDGFYKTDGFNVQKVSTDLPTSYKALEEKENIKGTFDRDRNRVIWAVQTNPASLDNDTKWVMHLDWPKQDGGYAFTTWGGGLDAENFSASAVGFIDGKLLRADRRGFILYHDDAFLSDKTVDPDVEPFDWSSQTIFYDYRSVAFDFGNSQVRKWVSKFTIKADNKSSMSLQVSTSNNDSGVYVDLVPIKVRLNPEWGVDQDIIWGVTEVRWDYAPAVSQWRWMNAAEQSLRCDYKQVKFSNAYLEIDSYLSSGTASINALTAEITLDDYPNAEWTSSPINYAIAFDTDDYETEYKIIGQDGGVLKVVDASGRLTNQTGVNWKIVGYKKNEILNILNYVLGYRLISGTQSTVGEND